jgi:hypothetical protein
MGDEAVSGNFEDSEGGQRAEDAQQRLGQNGACGGKISHRDLSIYWDLVCDP